MIPGNQNETEEISVQKNTGTQESIAKADDTMYYDTNVISFAEASGFSSPDRVLSYRRNESEEGEESHIIKPDSYESATGAKTVAFSQSAATGPSADGNSGRRGAVSGESFTTLVRNYPLNCTCTCCHGSRRMRE